MSVYINEHKLVVPTFFIKRALSILLEFREHYPINPMPMKHSTRTKFDNNPKESSLSFIKTFARLYNPQLNNQKDALFIANCITGNIQSQIN